MKIKLRELNPNPFKKQINGGKLNQEKIDKLKESIKSDGFWSGIMCREINGEYQIPFGHHRVESAKRVLGDGYVVDIPVLKLSDEQMVRMLANENSMQNEEYAIYQVDTVVMARDYLLEIRLQRNHISKTRPHEIGSAEHISEFLGEKNWSKEKVKQYLRMHEQLNPTILKNLKNSPNVGNNEENFTVSHARSIVRLNDDDQADVYKEITGKNISHREMNDVVSDVEKGSTAKEAVKKAVDRRCNKEYIKKALSPIEGQKLALLCDSLLKSVKSSPIQSFPPKGQVLLRKLYSQVVDTLTQELEELNDTKSISVCR